MTMKSKEEILDRLGKERDITFWDAYVYEKHKLLTPAEKLSNSNNLGKLIIQAMEEYHSQFTKQISEGWKDYDWNNINSRPKEYGRYEVFRQGADKQHYETWNGSGWASNNNDITHYRKIVKPFLQSKGV